MELHCNRNCLNNDRTYKHKSLIFPVVDNSGIEIVSSLKISPMENKIHFNKLQTVREIIVCYFSYCVAEFG